MKKNTRPTLKEIAKLAGVSSTAVSLYLNQRPGAEKFPETTQRRIDEVVRATGYRANFTARSLRTGRTRTIGLVVPHINTEYHSNFAETVYLAADARGYDLIASIIHWDREKELSALQKLIDRQVDGVIYLPLLTNTAPETLTFIRDTGYPIAQFDIRLDDGITVVCAFQQSIDELFRRFAARGFSRVAVGIGMGGDWNFSAGGETLEVYRFPYDDFTAIRHLILTKQPQAVLLTPDDLLAKLLEALRCDLPKTTLPEFYTFYSQWESRHAPSGIAGYFEMPSETVARLATDRLIDWIETGERPEMHRFILSNHFLDRSVWNIEKQVDV